MRNIFVSSSDDFAGCCAVGILYEFPINEDYNYDTDEHILLKGELSDDEWYFLLDNTDLSTDAKTALYTFANSSGGNTGPCTPTKLARWLRSIGEKVYTGANAVNPRSESTITLYSWAPSKEFYKKLIAYKNKKNKKDAAKSARGARAA
jgi:hypothetical protein